MPTTVFSEEEEEEEEERIWTAKRVLLRPVVAAAGEKGLRLQMRRRWV